jgi:uncharacterized protein (DUF488 family)
VTVWTIGHSTRSVAELAALLREAGVTCVADIRTVPRSRANPQYNTDALPQALAPYGIEYVHLPRLGGLRGRRKDLTQSPNDAWRNSSFRNYADYAMTDPFRAGLAELRRLAAERQTAMMCAEAVWWRCHRRIVTDYLLAADEPVQHILGPGHIEPARLTPGAEPHPDGTITYPAEGQRHPEGDLFSPRE